MGLEKRSRDDQRAIFRAAFAELSQRSLDSFDLDERELLYVRARTSRAIERLARNASGYRDYYELPTERPFWRVILAAGSVIAICVAAAIWVYRTQGQTPPYPIYAALISITAVASGWVVTSDLTHRNAIRQKTNDIIFARFSHAPFGDALFRFHSMFGYDPSVRVTGERMTQLRLSKDDDDRRAASAVAFVLNYFEFIASGVLRGDLDARVVRENVRGMVCYYYDRCSPHIEALNQRDPRTYEHLRKLRTSYREA